MEIREMQARVDAWISQFEEGYFPPPIMMLRLAEEVGELAREVNHTFGLKPKKPEEGEGSVALELADCLFVLVSLANALDIDLEAGFLEVMAKFERRDGNRWTRRSPRDGAVARGFEKD
jgi:NTP pyrophosphatase (non-canonical NTP hydrolase)